MQQLTTKVDPIIGIDHWNHAVTRAFCPMECKSIGDATTDRFSGNLHNTFLNRIHLARIASSALQVKRNKEHISQVSDAYYLVKLQIKGQGVIEHCSREAYLQPGDFVICSSSEPYKLHFPSDYYQAVLSIPQPILHELYHAPDDYLGVRMAGELPIHGLFSQFVISLIQRLDKLEPEIVQHLEANILDLLIMSLQTEDSVAVPQMNAAEQHLQHIKTFVGMHLKDPNLSPGFIAQAEGISKRYLHMLFKEKGISVSHYILQLRLESSYHSLTNPEMRHLSTTDIALDWGFGDVSHFHRCFKAQYRITPHQLRLQAQKDSP